MITPTQGEHAQTEALDDLYLKLHGMSKRLESSGRIDESDAPEAYPAILDAMNLVRRLQCEAAQVAALTAAPAQPAAAPQGVAYAEFPPEYCVQYDDIDRVEVKCFAEVQMRDFADRTHALRTQQPAPAAQADSQPAPDERDDFEKVFPLPSGCIRVGTGYASTGYSNWTAHTHCERWQGWQARAARKQGGAT